MTSQIRTFSILAGLLLLIGAVLFFKLGDVPLADPDEPRYAESAREMLELGSVMVPYFNYEPRLQKPVLHYWLICASYLMLGVSEFSARLPSALAALGVLIISFLFLRRFCGTGAAAGACLIMGSSPLYLVPGRLTMPDMVFSAFMIVSLFCFYLGWQAADSGTKKRWYAGFYAFQIIAAWVKGPVGIIVPVSVALLALWLQHDRKELKNLRLVRGLLCVLLLSLPWYAYIYTFVDRGTMTELSQRETLGRIFGWFGRNYDPLHYYFLVLGVGLLPWIFLAPWAVYQRMRKLAPSRLRSFLEIWFLFVFVFFSVCATKKAQYIVMLSCVFGLWLGSVFTDALRAGKNRPDTGLILSLLAFLLLAIAGSFKGISWVSKHQPELLAGSVALGCALIIPSLAAVWFAARGHRRSACGALGLVMLLGLIPAVSSGGGWVAKYRSIKMFLQENQALIAQADQMYAGVKTFNGLPFYLRRQVIMDTDEEVLLERLRAAEPCIVFTSDKRYTKHEQLYAPYLKVMKHGKVLLSNIAVKRESP